MDTSGIRLVLAELIMQCNHVRRRLSAPESPADYSSLSILHLTGTPLFNRE